MTDLKNNVLTEINGITLCTDPKGKMVHTKTEGNTFTKEIGQTVYGVRYYFNEDAKETMQKKINRMLVIEVNQPEI